MPTQSDTRCVPYDLTQLSHRQLTWLVMRELHHLYDHAGISMRCERSLVLESGLFVCSKNKDLPSDVKDLSHAEAKLEVDRRASSTYQLGLWQEPHLIPTDEFLALVAKRVQESYKRLPEPNLTEGAWITLLVDLTQVAHRTLPELSSEEIVREGTSRGTITPEAAWI